MKNEIGCRLEVTRVQGRLFLRRIASQSLVWELSSNQREQDKETSQAVLSFNDCVHVKEWDSDDLASKSLGNQPATLPVGAAKATASQKVFDRSVHPDVTAWNSAIIGHVNCSRPQTAIRLYQSLPKDGIIHINKQAFIALLKACASLNDLETGTIIHAEVARLGLFRVEPFIACSLVVLYARCGLLDTAVNLVEDFPSENVVLWNSLISGFAEQGHNDEAFLFFEEMQIKGVSPDATTYVCILKACGNSRVVDKGQEIHAAIERQGLLKTNLIIGNSVIGMYAKCGYLATAQHVFNDMYAHDRVSWNTLISGYAEHGFGNLALQCFGQMQSEGIRPDAITCVCCLKACSKLQAISKGQEIHAEIERRGMVQRNHYVGSSLVDMYGKCGLLAKAQEVFSRLLHQDVVSWNVLLASHAEYGNGKEVLKLLKDMHGVGVSPDGVSFVCCLKACGKLGDIQRSQEMHAEVEKHGLMENDLLMSSTLIDTYAKCGRLVQALQVFDRTCTRNVLLWNALIAGYVERGHGEEAVRCYEQMQLEGIFPDAATLMHSLKACGSVCTTMQGTKLRVEVERQGLLMSDVAVGNALVDMYAKCGLLSTAQVVFDNLPNRDIVTWNALIAGYAVHNLGEEALDHFEQMQDEGVCPNAVTFVCSLKACSSLGAFERGKELHIEIERRGLLEKDHIVGNNVVCMYANCGLLATARQVFEKLLVRDVVSWTALMTGYARLGQSGKVFHFYDEMLREGVKPNLVTFVVVLMTCSRTVLYDRSQTYFEAMMTAHGLLPALEHHTCIVDLLGRAGKLDIAHVMIRKTVSLPDSVMWHSLLDACRKWGNVEIGKRAFQSLVYQNKKGVEGDHAWHGPVSHDQVLFKVHINTGIIAHFCKDS